MIASELTNPARSEVDLSICVVTYNSAEHIRLFLRSLHAAAPTLRYEILLTDNASADDTVTRALIEAAEISELLQLQRNNENRFFTRADNQNISRAVGRYIVSINPDSIVMPGAFERMAIALASDAGLGAVAPGFVTEDGQKRPGVARFVTRLWCIAECAGINAVWPGNACNLAIMPPLSSPVYALAERQCEVLYGACIMIKREVLEQVGLKDEALIHGWDEYDWSKRIRDAGWRLGSVKDARVMHIEGASRRTADSATIREMDNLHFRGLIHLSTVHYGAAFGRVLQFLNVVVRPLMVATRRAFGRLWRRVRGSLVTAG